MASVTKYTTPNGTVVIEAAPTVVEGGVLKFFSTWTEGASTTIPAPYTTASRRVIFAAGTGDINLTANYVAGKTITLTQPGSGALAIVSPAMKPLATGYEPGVKVTVRYTPPTGTPTWVSAWTGTTTVGAEDPNTAYVDVTNSTGLTVSVTTTETQPVTVREVNLTVPVGAQDVAVNGL